MEIVVKVRSEGQMSPKCNHF